MKKVSLFLIIALSLSSCLGSFERQFGDTDGSMSFYGYVLDSLTQKPIKATVQITNGKLVKEEVVLTPADYYLEDYTSYYYEAQFYLYLSVEELQELDESYYLLIKGDGFEKKGRLLGFGHSSYDYGTIYVNTSYDDDPYLGSFQHAGYDYIVYTGISGSMNQEQASSTCSNLTYNGYSNWYLPDKDELNTLFVFRESLGIGYGGFWSSSMDYSNYSKGVVQSFSGGSQRSENSSSTYQVLCIRSK